MGFFSSVGSAIGGFFGGTTGGGIGGALGGLLDGNMARDDANDAARQSTQREREWLEQMSNTSMQRRVMDLKKAGLNPMLAYSQGGASTPASAAALTTGADTMINSGFTQSRVSNETSLARAQVANVEADTNNKVATAENIRTDTLLKASQIPVNESSASLNSSRVGEVTQNIEESKSRVIRMGHENGWSDAQVRKVIAELPGIVAQRGLISAQTSEAKSASLRNLSDSERASAGGQLLRLEVPKAFNASEAESTWWKRNVSPYLDEILGIGKGLGASALGTLLLRK